MKSHMIRVQNSFKLSQNSYDDFINSPEHSRGPHVPIHACEISFYIPNYCSLISKLNKATTKVHTGCHLPIYIPFLFGLCPKQKNMWNKWKNHFSEMQVDVGMSLHEKEGEQEDA